MRSSCQAPHSTERVQRYAFSVKYANFSHIIFFLRKKNSRKEEFSAKKFGQFGKTKYLRIIKMRKSNEMMSQMETLYESFYQRLFLYALTFLDNEDEAKDAVGEVFSKIWSQWEKRGHGEHVSQSFLYRLTRNRCLDILRHDKARRNYADFISNMPSFESDDDVLHYEHRISQLKEAIDKLPEPGKTILHCCYFKHMTYQQTAEKLQLTLVVIKKNMLKVFKILRKELNKPI